MKPFLFLMVVGSVLSVLSSCEDIFSVEIVGDGNVKRLERSVGNYTGLFLDSDFEVYISQGLAGSLTIEADSNILSYIVTEVNNGILEIGVKPNFSVVPRNPVRISFEVADNLSEVEIINGGKVEMDTFFIETMNVEVYEVSSFKADSMVCGHLEVLGEGSTNIEVSGSVDTLSVRQIGSGNMKLMGQSLEGELVLEGSGKIEADELNLLYGDVRLYGSGLILCRVSGKLKTLIEGNGRIYYYGMPEDLIKEIVGEGLVLPADD